MSLAFAAQCADLRSALLVELCPATLTQMLLQCRTTSPTHRAGRGGRQSEAFRVLPDA